MAQSDLGQLAASLRTSFYTGRTLSREWRVQQLQALRRMCFENQAEFVDANFKDLRKNEMETKMMELGMVFGDIDNALENLDAWMAPSKVHTKLVNKMDGCQIRRDPLGVVLIIAPWNYPFQLTLVPLVGALAAGNCTVIKPSEVAPATADLLAKLIPKYMDNECIRVVLGAVPETTALLNQKWDHILYTGGEQVARIVMKAASQHLTPVTLELGGKSPTFVDGSTNLRTAARRIAWGRFVNSGQSCIAPDYIMVTADAEERLLAELKNAIVAFYGENAKDSQSYGRIISKNHWKRVKGLLDRQEIVCGGKGDEKDLFIEPTIVKNSDPNAEVMKQEIFGPVLPVMVVRDHTEAIEFVNARPKPLALYVFSGRNEVVEDILTRTSSGSAVVNDTMMQASVDTLPFGGVGTSGMGAYHGKFSFDLFSHTKAVMKKSIGLEMANDLRYPPYSSTKLSRTQWVLGYPSRAEFNSGALQTLVFRLLLLVVALYLAQRYLRR